MLSIFSRSIALSCLCFTAVLADDANQETCPGGRRHFRATARHIEGGGIGYDQGYTTVETFLALNPHTYSVVPFLDARGHVFDNGKLAANAGLGLRGILGNRAYGINSFYDYRNTQKLHYNQVGLGLETLGKLWDLRINGYLPVGKKISAPYDVDFAGFSGNIMRVSRKFQYAMKGANAELGFHFGKSRMFDFYAAAGPYYYRGQLGHNAWGAKARLVGMFKEYITLEISDSYDTAFQNNFQGQIAFTVPFGPRSQIKKKKGQNSCKWTNALTSRMVQPVGREEIVVVDRKKKQSIATDPATGAPLHFVFVNNMSHSSGTFTDPYHSLAQAQANSGPGDIIYVFPGDGTTTGMDTGITLQASQKFWGSGNSHVVQTTVGAVTIPRLSSTAPQMTNTDGNGITLGTNNAVSGFTVTSATGMGVCGIDPENVDISTCTFLANQAGQVCLDFFDTSGVVTLDSLQLLNGLLEGISITSNTPSPITCSVNNCLIQGNSMYSFVGLFNTATTVSLTHNTILSNGGVNFFFFGDTGSLLVSGNTIQGCTEVSSAPLMITANDSPISAAIVNNTISDNACGAIHFSLSDTNGAQLLVSKNTITGNQSGTIGPFGSSLFIDPNTSSAGNCNMAVTDNLISGNDKNSIYIFNGSFNTLQALVTGNTISGNGGSGLALATACNVMNVTVENNTISHGMDNAISTGGGIVIDTATMTIVNNTITNNGNFGNGIDISHDGTTFNFIATHNIISDNASSGIVFFSSVGIENCVATIENNVINNNTNAGSNSAGGIDIEQFTNLAATLSNNTLLNNTSVGVYINSTDPTGSVCLEMNGNTTNTDYSLINGTGTFNLAPCDVNTVNTGTIIPSGVITSVESCPGAVPCPP